MNDTAAAMAGSGTMAAPDWRRLTLWVVAVALVYAAFGYFCLYTLGGYAAETRAMRAALVASPTVGTAPSPAVPVPSQLAGPAQVLVGARLNRIADIAPLEGAWTADFTLWFRWDDAALDPGKDFGVVNGQILQQDKLTSGVRGATRYEEYHVVARISQPFDALRFPFGEDVVRVRIEDKGHGLDRLRFVADERNSAIPPEAMPPNVDQYHPLLTVKSRMAATGSADPSSASAHARSRSQFVFGAVLEPKGLNIALRLFQALLVSVAVALLALFIKPIMIDCRFGLPIGAFFASVSNNSVVSSVVPRAAGRTLSDMITSLSLLTIFLVLVQSVIALYLFDTLGRERLARKFDHVSFVVILLGYLLVSVLLPLAAQSR